MSGLGSWEGRTPALRPSQVFQRREDGSVNFFRGWEAYRDGFGKLTGEHWLGESRDTSRAGCCVSVHPACGNAPSPPRLGFFSLSIAFAVLKHGSGVCSTFTELGDPRPYLIPEHLLHPKKKPCAPTGCHPVDIFNTLKSGHLAVSVGAAWDS